jgi:hypothetical protein
LIFRFQILNLKSQIVFVPSCIITMKLSLRRTLVRSVILLSITILLNQVLLKKLKIIYTVVLKTITQQRNVVCLIWNSYELFDTN